MLRPSISAYFSRLFLFLFFSVCLLNASEAQKSKSQLEQEKKENLKKIAEAEKILTETQSTKKITIGQLQAINQQIKARESLIRGLKQEVSLLNDEITDLNIVVISLQQDLEDLKDEYAAMIYSSYKANTGFNMITFLFSSSTFNQLFKRLEYLEQYADARKVQVEKIDLVAKELATQKGEVQLKLNGRSQLLNQQLRERRKLDNQKNDRSNLIAELAKKEKKFRREVANRKKAIAGLEKAIADLVKAELAPNKKTSLELASEEVITNTFEEQKTKMTWPVASGFISKKFGIQPHPVLKRIKTKNNGVDIQTNQDEKVRVVHDGEVKLVRFVQGMNNVVMVKHGSYFTVYSRLKKVSVEQGQKVKATDLIGEVYTDTDGISEVHFEVWKNTQMLDPEKWLTE